MKSLNEAIRNHGFFYGIDSDHLQLLAEGAKEVGFRAEEILFREGEPANQFYLIQSGKVQLEASGAGGVLSPVQTIGAGDVLGWSWLFPPFSWHFQGRAIEPTQAISLSASHLLAAAENNEGFGYELIKRVARVVIQRLQATRKLLLNVRANPSATPGAAHSL